MKYTQPQIVKYEVKIEAGFQVSSVDLNTNTPGGDIIYEDYIQIKYWTSDEVVNRFGGYTTLPQ